MATKQDVLNELKRRGYNGPLPQENAQAQQPQGEVASILSSLNRPRQGGILQDIGDAMVVFGGGKPQSRGDMSDLNKILLREELTRTRPTQERPVDAARRGKIERESEFLDSYLQGSGDKSNLPPGTTLRAGPLTIPMNPKLTESEQASLSSLETFEPQVAELGKSVQEGVFTPGGGGVMSNLKRTAEQFAVDQPGKAGRLMTSMNPKLQAVQSDLNSIRRYAFGEGGKNLTVNEKEIVNALLDMTGKADEQILSDHQKALGILRSKAKLALGGANAAQPVTQGQPIQTPQSSPQVGQIVQGADGRSYRIVGGDPNDPDVELVQ